MDFLDQPEFATVDRAVYAELLGLGNKKQKSSAQNEHGADIQNRFPFSDNCSQQKKIVEALLAESAATGAARNSSKKGKTRNALTGKLQAFDKYIPLAIEHMNSVACSAKNAGSAANKEPASNLPLVPTDLVKPGMSVTTKMLIGAGILVAVVAAVIIIKKRKNSS